MNEINRPFLRRSFRHPLETPEEREVLESLLVSEVRRQFAEAKVPRFSEIVRNVFQQQKIESSSTNPNIHSEQAHERWKHYYEYLLKTPLLEDLRQESQRLLKERIALREVEERATRERNALLSTSIPEGLLRQQMREAELLQLQDQRRSGRSHEEDIP